MNPDLLSELRKIRNEIVHGLQTPEPAALAERLSKAGLSVAAVELPELIPAILQAVGGHPQVPTLLLDVMARLLEGRAAALVCDPWAGLGAVLATVRAATHAAEAVAFTPNKAEWELGRKLFSAAEWQIGEPLRLLDSLKTDLDVVASNLPFGAKTDRPIVLARPDGGQIELRDDLGNLILASAAMRLSADGVGLFVVPQSFFFSQRSVFRRFPDLGLTVEAALALPVGLFAPYTNISTYLVIIGKRALGRIFVAQLSTEAKTNARIIMNLKEGKEGGALELGRFVDPLSFTGLDSIRTAERVQQAEGKFGAPALRLEELATAFILGRHGSDFEFRPLENAIFVPLIGNSDVTDSPTDFTLKRQNYAQVGIDPARSYARFVAQFLNSEFGREIREASKAGLIPKLNTQSLKSLRVFVPSLSTQKTMLEIEARIVAEQNTLLGLQNELGEYRRELWTNPRSAPDVDRRITALLGRLSGGLKQHAADSLDQWFETLPFPLASILRAWQATQSQDIKTKYEHLLHFFEGLAEFSGVILLSAFSSNEAFFEPHRQKLMESLREQELSYQRASFGTWKLVVEYLGKRARQLLSGDKDARALCADLFSDPSLVLPEALSRKGLAGVLSTTNKWRNDWKGHSGVVGDDEAHLRNEQLLGEVQNMREAMADTWAQTHLIQALHCRLRRGVFENNVSVLMGSNSEFLKETRSMSLCLDVESLYLSNKESGRALKLLPLVRLGQSPQSAKNACYFFNRLERDGARFVSYHFTEKPELTGQFDEATAVIKSLTGDQ